jgi:hypothetical protein
MEFFTEIIDDKTHQLVTSNFIEADSHKEAATKLCQNQSCFKDGQILEVRAKSLKGSKKFLIRASMSFNILAEG